MIRRRARMRSRRAVALPMCAALCAMTGCRGTPQFNILGSFFPAWMGCLLVGVILTLLLRWLFQRIDLEKDIHPLVLVYPALVTFFTCTLWLLFFS